MEVQMGEIITPPPLIHIGPVFTPSLQFVKGKKKKNIYIYIYIYI